MTEWNFPSVAQMVVISHLAPIICFLLFMLFMYISKVSFEKCSFKKKICMQHMAIQNIIYLVYGIWWRASET